MKLEPSHTQMLSGTEMLARKSTPKSVSDLSRNPDKASAWLSTTTQLVALCRDQPPTGRAAGVLHDWYFLSLQVTSPTGSPLTTVHVLGAKANGHTVFTTDVKSIEPSRGLVKTKNSIYQLDLTRKGNGDLTQEQLNQVWANLAKWGYAEAFNIPGLMY